MAAGVIHHLVPAADWQALPAGQAYLPAALSADGFIHCTTELDVLLHIANRFYRDAPGEFFVLVIDPARLAAPLRYEPPSPAVTSGPLAGKLFPHIYGPLNPEAVVAIRVAQRAPDGTFLAL